MGMGKLELSPDLFLGYWNLIKSATTVDFSKTINGSSRCSQTVGGMVTMRQSQPIGSACCQCRILRKDVAQYWE